MKQYAVEVLEKVSHGIYGKEKYTVWSLSETSKQRACYFAAEIVAGMTWRELLREARPEELLSMYVPFGCKLDDIIGYENAEKCFSYRAFLQV